MSDAGASPGVTMARQSARRLQQSIAFATVVFPFLGVIAAFVLFWNRGISGVEVVALAVMYFICCCGITVGFHRYFAHQSYTTSRPLKILLAICGSMAMQGPIVFWVAVHRRHHALSDRPGDPHSPNLHGDTLGCRLRGLWHAHIGWMFTTEQTDWSRFSPDVLRDRDLFFIHRTYLTWVLLGLALPAAVAAAVTHTWMGALQGFLWGGLVRIFLVNHSMWCVGSVAHMFGTHPFQTHDKSANNYTVALFSFGEGLQNNHHAFPTSFSHAIRWWQPDLSALVIRVMQFTGLIWDLKQPSPKAIADARLPRSAAARDTDHS